MICINEPHYAIAIAIAQRNGCCSNIIVVSKNWPLFRSQSCCPIKRDYLGILPKCRNPLPPLGNPCFQKKYYGLFCILGPWELSARDHNVARMDHLCHKFCLKAGSDAEIFWRQSRVSRNPTSCISSACFCFYVVWNIHVWWKMKVRRLTSEQSFQKSSCLHF